MNRATVVSPLGSGSHLAPLFDRDGWDTVAVLTSADLPASMLGSLRREHHREVIGPGVPADGILARVAGLPVGAVLPGTETGVELADELGAALGTAGNPPARRACRRDSSARSA